MHNARLRLRGLARSLQRRYPRNWTDCATGAGEVEQPAWTSRWLVRSRTSRRSRSATPFENWPVCDAPTVPAAGGSGRASRSSACPTGPCARPRYTGTRPTASVARRSRSSAFWMINMAKRTTAQRFLLCVKNDAYPASLELRKVYEEVPDPEAAAKGFVRVIGES